MKKSLLITLTLFLAFNVANSNAIVIPTNFNYKFIGWDETGQRPNYLYGTDVILNGSSLTGTYDQGSITHSLTIKSGATVLSTIQSKNADKWGEIYVSGTENNKGELNLDGGTVLVETLTGLTIIPDQYADINIKSGTLIGRAPKFVPSSFLEQYQDEEDDDWVSDAIFHSGYGDINISGGTIDLENSCILKESAYDSDEDITGDINISGGTFNLKEADIYSMNALNITGGTFSLDNTDLSSGDDEFEGTENNNMLIKNATITGIDSDIESTYDITIDKANISLTSTDSDDESYGIWAENNLTIKNNATINLIDSYLASGNNIGIEGGTINLQDGSRISITEKHTGDINITGGTINGIKTQDILSENDGDSIDSGKIEHLGTGDINIKGNAVINFVASEIQKGFHEDDSDRAQGNVNISENARITLSHDTHINSDQNVNISGGITSLSYNGSIDAYGDVNVSGGTLNIGEENGNPLSLEADDWSAISSHYKDGNVKISGGTINLYNNGAIGRIANIDDGMDKSQFGDRITGDIDISGGKIIANGNSEIIVASGDGLEDIPVYSKIKISNNADITLKDKATMENRSLGNIEMTGGKLSLNDDSRLRGDSSFNIGGGRLTVNSTKGVDAKNVNISGNATVSVNAASFSGMEEFNISGGTISLQSAELAAVESEGLEQRQDSTFTMTGGTINASNSIIGAMIHQNWKADDDIYQGNKINITGGEINFTGKKNYLIGSDINFDGTMNIASNTTLNVYEKADYSNANSPETVAFSTKGTLKTDGTNDDADGINLSGTLNANIQGDGGLNFKTSTAKVNGNVDGSSVLFAVDHTLTQAITGTISSLKSLNITNNATLTYNYSGAVNPIEKVNVTSGSTLKIADNLEYATFRNSDMQISGTIDGSIWGDMNNSTLKFSGKNATITGGDALDFKTMEFNNTEMTLQEQDFYAKDNLTIDSSNLNFEGDVIMESGDGVTIKNSEINVNGKGNKISATNTMSLTDNNIYIKKNSALTLSARDSTNYFDVSNTNIYLINGGQLLGNAQYAATINIIERNGPSGGGEMDGPISGSGNVSDYVEHVIDLGNLTISGKSNLTLDKGGLFTFSEDNEDYRRIYETGKYMNKEYYLDEVDFRGEEEDEDDIYRPYENQIIGTLTIDGQSTVTAKANFAADKIVVDNGSTLSATDVVLGGRALTVDNGSKVSLLGSKKYIVNGFDESVTVNNGSTLISNMIDIGGDDDEGVLTVAGGSTLTLSNGETYAKIINIENSALNLTKVRFKANGGTDAQMTLDNTALNANSSFAHNDGNLSIANSDNIRLSNKSALFGGNTTIENSNITADNSQVGAFTHALKIDAEDKDISNRLSYHYGEPTVTELNVTDSIITLNGASELGAYLAITEWSTTPGLGSIVGYVTEEIAADASVLLTKYKGYELREDQFGDNNSVLGVENHQTVVNIDGTTVTMNGTSSIINAMLNTENDSGDINITNGSNIVAKGKGNLISATGGIYVSDSTLEVAKGAVLNVQSEEGNVINVDNARIKLAGTFNGTFSGTIDTLILGAKATYSNGAFDDLAGDINSFGISGITSAKDVARVLGGINSMDTFEVTDKSNFTWDDIVNAEFNNLNVENSTLSIKGDKGMWMGDVTATGSTVKILAGTLIVADEMDLTNTALTISGTALKKGETDYADLISTINGLNVDNSDNTKAAVSISNIALSTDVNISNVAKVTLTNVLAYENLNIAGTVTETAKGNTYNTVATLNNVAGNDMVIDDAKATIQKGSSFENIAVTNKGAVDFKDNIATALALSDTATATLAAKKTLTGDVTLNDDGHLILQGIIDGDVDGNGGLLEFSNAAAKVTGNVEGVALGFNKTKSNLSKFFEGDVNNVTATKLSGATLTDDMNDVDFGELWMQKSTLTLQHSAEAALLMGDTVNLNLGTNTLRINGDASLVGKSNIAITVDKNKHYGQLVVNGGTLELGKDAKGNGTTNLAVTLDKSLVNSKFTLGETFDFLDYGEVDGILGKVTIANNRVTFTETLPGQFEITEKISGKGVIERYATLNPMSAAAAIVDSTTEFTSAKQNKLADDLNALSQVVGGEKAYIQALEATNPDDTNMIAENTVATVDTVLSAVAERTSSSGISSATEGMASGDTPNGASVWTKVLYNKGKLDSSSSYAGFKSKSNGVALGVDKFINKDVKLGLGYAYTNGDIKNNIRKSDVDTHTAMLYGEYKPSDWFVNGSLSYGWSDYSNKAFSALGTTKSDFDVYATAVQMNTGYDVNIADKTTLTPVVGLRYINVAQDSYKDSDDKYVAKAHSDIVTALASAKLKKSFELNNNAIITPEVRLGVSYDIVNDGTNSVVKLSNGSSYIVEGRALKRFGFETGAGITAELNDNWEFSAGYEGRFRKDYHDHTGMLNLKYNF